MARFDFNRIAARYHQGRAVGEEATLTMDAVDLYAGHIRVMGKGREERNMPFGEVVKESRWDPFVLWRL